MHDELLNTTEASHLLRKPEATLSQWRYLGKGPRYVKLGRHVMYRRRDVEQYIDEHTVDPRPAA